jgi:hypothetical protein
MPNQPARSISGELLLYGHPLVRSVRNITKNSKIGTAGYIDFLHEDLIYFIQMKAIQYWLASMVHGRLV